MAIIIPAWQPVHVIYVYDGLGPYISAGYDSRVPPNYDLYQTHSGSLGASCNLHHETASDQFTHDDVIKWKHFPCYWTFVRGIHRSRVNSPHKGQWRKALIFSLMCAWINGWVNNREAGDLRCHSAHYGVIVMCIKHLRDRLEWAVICMKLSQINSLPVTVWISTCTSMFNFYMNEF